jgi:hypothetical protein
MYANDVFPGVWGTAMIALAGILALTSALGYCPLYSLVKIPVKKERSNKDETKHYGGA